MPLDKGGGWGRSGRKKQHNVMNLFRYVAIGKLLTRLSAGCGEGVFPMRVFKKSPEVFMG